MRGYDLRSSTVFAARGTFLTGGTAGYSSSTYDHGQLLVFEGIEAETYSLSLKPCFAYMIRDNVAAGFRPSYKRSLVKIDEGGMSVADVDIAVDDYYLLSHKGGLELFVRPYIPISGVGRIAMFAELGASGFMSESKNSDGHKDPVVGTWQRSFGWEAGVHPGISAFITNHLAIELGMGLFGFSGTRTNQIHNQVGHGERGGFGAHFMVDLSSINVGVMMYL